MSKIDESCPIVDALQDKIGVSQDDAVALCALAIHDGLLTVDALDFGDLVLVSDQYDTSIDDLINNRSQSLLYDYFPSWSDVLRYVHNSGDNKDDILHNIAEEWKEVFDNELIDEDFIDDIRGGVKAFITDYEMINDICDGYYESINDYFGGFDDDMKQAAFELILKIADK